MMSMLRMECLLMLEMLWHVHILYVRGGAECTDLQGPWHLLLATFIRWMLCMFVGAKVH